MIRELLKLFLLPVTVFRSLMAFFSMIWTLLIITIIILIVVYWDDVKKVFDNVIEGIDNIQNTVNTINNKVDKIEEQAAANT